MMIQRMGRAGVVMERIIVVAVCAGSRRQDPKSPLDEGLFDAGKGLRNDAHWGFSDRHVSLLREEDVTAAEAEAGFSLPPGSLAENLRLRGLPEVLPLGSLLKGPEETPILRVRERGKRADEPHSYDYRGWCLLPKVGYFLEVLRGGVLRPGDALRVEEPD